MHSSSSNRPALSNFRWVICALLFFSTTVNYMDRQVISYLKDYFCTPADQGGFGWSNTDFSHLTAFFTGFYAGMTILAGWVIDKIGTKLGLALSLIVWSVFGILNAFVRPILMLLALPLLIFTLGLFTLVINALLLYFVGVLMGSHFQVDSFGFAFLGAIIISIVSIALNALTGLGKARVTFQHRPRPPTSDKDDGPVIDV